MAQTIVKSSLADLIVFQALPDDTQRAIMRLANDALIPGMCPPAEELRSRLRMAESQIEALKDTLKLYRAKVAQYDEA